MLKSQKKHSATAVKRSSSTPHGPNATSARTLKTRPHNTTANKPPSPTLKANKSSTLIASKPRVSPFRQSSQTFATQKNQQQLEDDSAASNFSLDDGRTSISSTSSKWTGDVFTNGGGTIQLSQDKGSVDQDGIPTRRLNAKSKYVEDHELTDLKNAQNENPEIKDWVAYKELSTLVTSGDRANVYHWLSNRDNRLKVDLNVRDPFGSTLLAQATRRHYYAVALTLLPFCDTNYETLQGPPIFHSLALADLLITRALLDFGADPNSRNPQDQTPLMMASCVDNPSFIQYLIFKGARLDDTDSSGRTALMYAAKKCSPQIAKYLHICGADISIQDAQGRTASDYARQRGDRDGDYLANILSRPPPTQRILPDREIIQVDLETYRKTKLFPTPLNLAEIKSQYHLMAKNHGYQNMIIDPNGGVSLKNPNQQSRVSSPLFVEDGDSLPQVTGGNYTSDINSGKNNDFKRSPPTAHQRRTVLEDLFDRGDFTQRPIEHVDQRYLEWYNRCRAIHLEDDVFRSQGNGQAPPAKTLKDQKQ